MVLLSIKRSLTAMGSVDREQAKLVQATARNSGADDSHWWFKAPGCESPAFKDVNGKVLVELRAYRQQTVVAPTVHLNQDRYIWNNNGLPMEQVPSEDLTQGVRELKSRSARTYKALMRNGTDVRLTGRGSHASSSRSWKLAGDQREERKR